MAPAATSAAHSNTFVLICFCSYVFTVCVLTIANPASCVNAFSKKIEHFFASIVDGFLDEIRFESGLFGSTPLRPEE